MNELKVFNYDGIRGVRVVSKDGDPLCVYLGKERFNKYELLAFADHVAHEDYRMAWEVMSLASKLFHPDGDWAFNKLYGSVACHIAWIESLSTSEYAIHKYFKDNCTSILGEEYRLINKKGNARHVPDAWVAREGEEIPVEMKKGHFDAKALSQLQRYLKFYGCKNGIAVGKILSVDLPDNIKFVCCAGW